MSKRDDDYLEFISYLNERDSIIRQRKKHRLPLESYTISDSEFFVTICARHQQHPFTDDALARAVIASLIWCTKHYGWFLYCYCLMPDHLHFILRLAEHEMELVNAGGRGIVPCGVLEQIGQFKRYTTTQIWWKHGGNEKLWQRSSYDRVIRYNDSIEEAVSYTINNPVRKNLVEMWDQYPYSFRFDVNM